MQLHYPERLEKTKRPDTGHFTLLSKSLETEVVRGEKKKNQ